MPRVDILTHAFGAFELFIGVIYSFLNYKLQVNEKGKKPRPKPYMHSARTSKQNALLGSSSYEPQTQQLYMVKKTHKSHSMEEEKGMMEMSISAGGTPSSSRWNPTKEQISLLEALYMQGIRTPSADQIQQITSRLKAYGHIEGKNVFYWFQNHKARQRQKQKQESLLYFNRFLRKATPILPPPSPTCTNGLCNPYFIPKPAVGFYPQYPKVPPPGGLRRRSSEDEPGEKTKKNISEGYGGWHPVADTTHDDDNDTIGRKTLQLFPLHPTGILEERWGNASPSTSTVTCNNLSFSSNACDEEDGREKELINFFFAGKSQ